MLAGELSAAVLARAAQRENGGRASTGGYHSIPLQGHGQDASAADSSLAAAAAREYAQGAPGTGRLYGPEPPGTKVAVVSLDVTHVILTVVGKNACIALLVRFGNPISTINHYPATVMVVIQLVNFQVLP